METIADRRREVSGFAIPTVFKCSKTGHLSVAKVDADGNSMPLTELNKLDLPLEVSPMTAIMGNGRYLERFVVSVHWSTNSFHAASGDDEEAKTLLLFFVSSGMERFYLISQPQALGFWKSCVRPLEGTDFCTQMIPPSFMVATARPKTTPCTRTYKRGVWQESIHTLIIGRTDNKLSCYFHRSNKQ